KSSRNKIPAVMANLHVFAILNQTAADSGIPPTSHAFRDLVLAGLREVIRDVRFADRIAVVLSRQSSSRAMTARKDGKSRCTVYHTKRAATSS
ncbi:MAG: hypothetical protein M3Z96_11305, partial [Pseudomonadota bacterium]|nr:hypothetical protein [Pseudomonadota bacterium]